VVCGERLRVEEFGWEAAAVIDDVDGDAIGGVVCFDGEGSLAGHAVLDGVGAEFVDGDGEADGLGCGEEGAIVGDLVVDDDARGSDDG